MTKRKLLKELEASSRAVRGLLLEIDGLYKARTTVTINVLDGIKIEQKFYVNTFDPVVDR
jgi:hypothetical protein